MTSFERRRMEAAFLLDWADSGVMPPAYQDWLTDNGFLLEARAMAKRQACDWLNGGAWPKQDTVGQAIMEEEALRFFSLALPEQEMPLVMDFFRQWGERVRVNNTVRRALASLLALVDYREEGSPKIILETTSEWGEAVMDFCGLKLKLSHNNSFSYRWKLPAVERAREVARLMMDPRYRISLSEAKYWPTEWPGAEESKDE